MAADGSKQGRVSATLPPRTLDVHKFGEARASELETLHSIVANRLDNDFRSRRVKRRRTTGYDNRAAAKHRYRRSKKQKLGLFDQSHSVDLEEKVPRRVRRRLQLRNNPNIGYCTSGDGTKRLRTHIWHAKRFTMTKLWGFHLPLGVQGGGRGSRALLKKYKNGVLIHDASYFGAVQLEGPEDMLLSILSMVLEPSPSACSEDNSHSLLSGAIHGSAMLHHVGATLSRTIAPVTYMWRPLHMQKIDIDSEDHPTTGCVPHKVEGSSSFRQLWVLLHASAFDEGFDALKLACQKQTNETGVSIKCISLEGQLAKLEVMGSKAFQILQKILHPVSSISVNSGQLHRFLDVKVDAETSSSKKSSILENEDHFSSSMITSFIVSDPRALPEKRVSLFPEATSTGQLGILRDDEGKNAELYTSSLSKLGGNINCSDRMDLWDASKEIRPPVEENVLCMEKHQQKLDFFCLGNTNFGIISADEQFSTLCPIMLINDNNQKGSLTRCSIVLPLNWVKAFWVPFVSSGAHAIGLRERHWIACEIGLPHFPSDFPDCNAYTCFMAAEAAASDQKAKLRPPAMRPFKIPIPPPWEVVRFSLNENLCRVRDSQTHSEELSAKNTVSGNSLTNPDCGNCNIAPLGPCGVSFDGFVARTSFMLTEFLKSINGDHLLLFPSMPDRKKCIYMFMKDEGKFGCGPNRSVSLVTCGKNLCFIRVLLHAYKEGVFEEGAVVCAPWVTDIAQWISSSDSNDGDLQVPQSSLTSYFIEQPSGEWVLQIPDNPLAQDSHRWPIGFVTTGFVRGSKKPAAQALCEAVLLARLREEQWNSMPVKQRRKEIYVLVRNLRSTAYRLALATIVLEQREEDVEYM